MLLSACPQMLVYLYFIGLQAVNDFVLPFEVSLNLLAMAVMLPEIVLCFRVANKVVQQQAQSFYLSLALNDEDCQEQFVEDGGFSSAATTHHPNFIADKATSQQLPAQLPRPILRTRPVHDGI